MSEHKRCEQARKQGGDNQAIASPRNFKKQV